MTLGQQIEKLTKYSTKTYGRSFQGIVLYGLRGMEYKGIIQPCEDEIDQFNDLVVVVNDGKGQPFKATLDPGLAWIRKPMAAVAKKGTARLEEGLYYYKRGLHKGIEALVQDSKVTVKRDSNRDGIWEQEQSDTGFFAINIHPKLANTKNVSTNSAGCTVIDSMAGGNAWLMFKSSIYQAAQVQFPYVVMNQPTALSVLFGK